MRKQAKPKLSVTERRIQALQNELEGSREFCAGLREHLELYPNDKWAQKSLEHYEQRVKRLSGELEQLKPE